MSAQRNMLIGEGDQSPVVEPSAFDTQPTDPAAAIQYAMRSEHYPEIAKQVQVAYALSHVVAPSEISTEV